MRFQSFFPFWVAFLLLPSGLLSQSTYEPLKCSGSLPADFTMLSRDKSAVDVKNEKEQYKSSTTEERKKIEFIKSSNYLVDELLLSGRVLFNDPLTQYLNEILNEVCGNDPSLHSKLRIYTFRSTEVNAFATNNGLVFVTTALLAEVENEAQLAFIIGHEITHYEKRHVINSYLEQERIFSENRYKTDSYDARVKEASSYSKELEIEADMLGLQRMAKSKYDLKEGLHSMDILQFSHLPFDEVPFNFEFFENQFLKIPKALKLDSVAAIDFSGDRLDDSKSSHPNIKKRRELLENELAKLGSNNGKKFVQPKETFLEIQRIARFETIRLLLADRQYAEAFYESNVLLKLEPGNMYLKEAMSKALYGMAKYKIAKKYSKTCDGYEDIEGEMQQNHFFFETLSAKQLTYLACRQLYDICQVSKNSFLKMLRDDLFITLINKYDVSYARLKKDAEEFIAFHSPKKEEVIVETPKDSTAVIEKKEEEVSTSKYDKLRKQKKEISNSTNSKDVEDIPFHQGAFADIINSPELKSYIEERESAAEAVKNEYLKAQEAENAMTSYQRKAKESKEETIKRKKGLSLGLEKVVFVDPMYLSVDKTEGLSFEASEQKLVDFSNDLTEVSSMAGLNSEVIAPKIFTSADVEKYNNMSAINFWLGERLDHDEIDMIPLECEYAAKVAEQYGTKDFVFSGVLSFKEKKENIGFAILAICLVYTAPYGIWYLAKPNWHTYYYTMVYDVTNGKCKMDETLDFNMKDNRSLIKSQMYDIMIQMKRK